MILAWEISQTEEPGMLQSMGFQIIGHDLTTKQQQKSKYREKKMQKYSYL